MSDKVKSLLAKKKELEEQIATADLKFDSILNLYLKGSKKNEYEQGSFRATNEVEKARLERDYTISSLEREIAITNIDLFLTRREIRASHRQLSVEEYEQSLISGEQEKQNLRMLAERDRLEYQIRGRCLQRKEYTHDLETPSLLAKDEVYSLKYLMSLMGEDDIRDEKELMRISHQLYSKLPISEYQK